MRSLLLTLLLITSILAVSNFKSSKKNVVSTTVRSLGFPKGILKCSEGLLRDADVIFANGVTEEGFYSMCKGYHAASECIFANASSHAGLYKDLTSGIRYACFEEYSYFRSILSCIHSSVTSQVQDSGGCGSCFLKESLTSMLSSKSLSKVWNQGGDGQWLKIIKQSGNVCKSLSCYLKCIRKDFNSHCGSSGTKFVEMIIRPIEVLTQKYRIAGANSIIYSSVPEECHMFLNPAMLDDLRFDEDFMTKMRILLATRKRQQLSSNYTEGERIIKEILMAPSADLTLKPKDWDTTAVLYLIFMISLIGANLIGLTIVLWWCLRAGDKDFTTKHENNSFNPTSFSNNAAIINTNEDQLNLEELNTKRVKPVFTLDDTLEDVTVVADERDDNS